MSLNIIFMGTPNFAVSILRSIHQSQHKILSFISESNNSNFLYVAPSLIVSDDEIKYFFDSNLV